MGWDIGKAFGAIGHAVGRVVHGVAVDGAKGLEKVVESAPIMDTFTPMADRIDTALQNFTAVDFPRKLDVGRPASYAPLPPGQPTDVIQRGGVSLTAQKATSSFGIHLDKSGDARLDLTAAGPGTDWGKKGAESAVMSVYVDGKYQQDLVLWGGDKANKYGLALGNLPAGDHTITLRYAQEKSRPGARGVVVSAGTATAVEYKTKEDQWAAQNAPYIIGRHGGLENTYTDVPLALAHRVVKEPDGNTTIEYTGVFSNEDSGDGGQPTVEQARWGRLTDLETMFRVTVDPNGKVVDRQVEGIGHKWRSFAGETDGTHPIIRTASDNNNMTDTGNGVLRFQLPTDYPVSDNAPIEDVMRQDPRFFQVEAKELLREGKIDPHGACSAPDDSTWAKAKGILADIGIGKKDKMADPRDYLYLQFKAEDAENDPIVARVVLKDGVSNTADAGHIDVAIARDGWSQTAVKLPPGTKPSDIASIEYLSKGTGHVTELGHAYTLDDNFQPIEVNSPAWNRRFNNPAPKKP